ncbi:hypothetical protein TWF281_011256 [Arthrobotrys megalospora]
MIEPISFKPVSFEPVSFELISTWLEDCTKNHKLCRSEFPPKLPMRVIDVLSRDDPLLLETDGGRGDYFALSYCWGKQRNIDMMTFGPKSKGKRGQPDPKPNIEAHKARIPFSSMPKTLQDAVIISRRLGVKYLWIDALCIIQGDDEEWEKEHPKMADIYANAKLVIAADNADGLEKGFLNRKVTMARPEEGGLQRIIPQAQKQHNLERSGTRKTSPMCSSPLSWNEPLNKRAWSLSEVIFANRIVHFTSSVMVWECNEFRHCESGCSHIFQENDDDSFRLFRNILIANQSTKAELYHKWDTVVEHFTRRQINSQPEEKYKDPQRLVAISRAARRFSQILEEVLQYEDEYLAGVWKGNLTRSLLWSVEKGLQQYLAIRWRRPEAPRAPTWSWAAVEGPVFFEPLVNFQPAIHVKEATVKQCDSDDQFGQVISGKLVVQGKALHKLKIQLEDHAYLDHVTGHRCRICSPRFDEGCLFTCDAPLSEANTHQEFSCLYLGNGEHEGDIQRETGLYYAILLLRPVAGATQVFERVGISSHCIRNDGGSTLLDTMIEDLITII